MLSVDLLEIDDEPAEEEEEEAGEVDAGQRDIRIVLAAFAIYFAVWSVIVLSIVLAHRYNHRTTARRRRHKV